MDEPCDAFDAAVGLLERRWAAAVVRVLLDGPRRFTDIRAALPGVTDAVLTGRLRELCAWGLMTRTEAHSSDVRYALTPAGLDLRPVLEAVEAYGRRNADVLGQLPARRRRGPSASSPPRPR